MDLELCEETGLVTVIYAVDRYIDLRPCFFKKGREFL